MVASTGCRWCSARGGLARSSRGHGLLQKLVFVSSLTMMGFLCFLWVSTNTSLQTKNLRPPEMETLSNGSPKETSAAPKPAKKRYRENRIGSLLDFYPGGFDDTCRSLAERCSAKPPLLLMLIHSGPARGAFRDAWRALWAAAANSSGSGAWLLAGFVVARTPDAKLNKLLEEEQWRHGDLIRPAFHDSYSNVTLKSLAMLEWTSIYCRDAQILMKKDDDVAVSLVKLKRYVLAVANETLVSGRLDSTAKPVRGLQSRHFVPKEMFGGKLYPPFTFGGGYVLSGSAPQILHAAAFRKSDPVRFLSLEDVTVTGVLREATGIPIRDVPQWMSFDPKTIKAILAQKDANCTDEQWVVVHGVQPKQIGEVSKRMDKICSKA